MTTKNQNQLLQNKKFIFIYNLFLDIIINNKFKKYYLYIYKYITI